MTVAATPEIELLEQKRDALLVELAARRGWLKFLEDNRLVWERGGWEAVVALRDRRIRGLLRQVETERADAGHYRNSARYWKDQAIRLGHVSGPEMSASGGQIGDREG